MYISLPGSGQADGVHIVELVGPAGAGKSSLLKALAGAHGASVTRERAAFGERLSSAVRSLTWVIGALPPSRSDARRAFLTAHHLHSRLAISRRLGPGVHLWDEGPFRKPLDNRFKSARTARAVVRLAESELRRARGRGIFHHFIRITASPDTRAARCGERGESFTFTPGREAAKSPCAFELLQTAGSTEPALRSPWPSLSNDGEAPVEAVARQLQAIIEAKVAQP